MSMPQCERRQAKYQVESSSNIGNRYCLAGHAKEADFLSNEENLGIKTALSTNVRTTQKSNSVYDHEIDETG